MSPVVLAIERRLEAEPEEIAARSWNALARPLVHDAELTVSTVSATAASAVLLGRFQRLPDAASFHPERPRLRRVSGGTHLLVSPGSVHLLLALRRPAALVACTPATLVNRHVRPVLRAIGGAYFGRDWIAGSRIAGEDARRPVAFAGFAHDATTGRAALEVLLPATPDWCDPDRASHRGLAPSALGDAASFVDAITAAFEAAFGAAAPLSTSAGDAPPPADATPWTATIDEAMGPLHAGRDAAGALRLGGEIFASADRAEALASAVEALYRAGTVTDDAAGALVDAAFTDGTGTLVGVKDLAHVRDVLLAAAAV